MRVLREAVAHTPGIEVVPQSPVVELLSDERGQCAGAVAYNIPYRRMFLVNNVETIAHVSHILRQGAAWYRALGIGDAAGTKLYSLSGDVLRPGLYELPMGTPLRELVFSHGGGMLQGKEFKAVFTGGSSNTILTAEELDAPLDWDSLRARRSHLGTGAMIVISEGASIVRRVADYLISDRRTSVNQKDIRSRFRPDEWECLMRGFTQPAILVSMAEPGGTLEETFYTFVALNEARTQFAQIPLIQALLTPDPEEELARRAAEAQRARQAPFDPDRFQQQVLADLRQALELLRRAGSPAEVAAYQQLVLHVCTRVAGAYREGSIMGAGGLAVAPAEQAAIDAVQAAMVPPPWIERMVDRIKDLFGGTSRGPDHT